MTNMIVDTLIRFVSGYSAIDLRTAIMNNVLIYDVVEQQQPIILFSIKLLLGNQDNKLELLGLNSNIVLEQLKSRRPDLYDAIMKAPNGVQWLDKNISYLKEKIL